MTTAEIVGKNVRRIRNQVGISQYQMALNLGMSSSNLCNIERGTANPTVETLDSIAAYFGIPCIALYESRQNNEEHSDFDTYLNIPGATYVYYTVPEVSKYDGIGEYLTFGIRCDMVVEQEPIYIGMIHDVDTSEKRICTLLGEINGCDLHPIHLYSIFEDKLWHAG